jgi:hypothetical protein
MSKLGLAWDVVLIDAEQQRARFAPAPRASASVGGANA